MNSNMNDIDGVFRNRVLNLRRLSAYGFEEQEGCYVYSTRLMGGLFEMTVSVAGGGEVSARVVDLSTQEQYTLFRASGACGAFVGRVRQGYENVLADIAEKCFDKEVFKSEYAKLIIEFAKEKYQDDPEFLWEKFPQNAIFRRKNNAKWYAALLNLSGRKLGFDCDEYIDIIDLRCEPEVLSALVDGIKYFPGYHMNKKHWLTICLDGSVPIEEIYARIETSYDIAGHAKQAARLQKITSV